MADISELIGKTLKSVKGTVDDDQLWFHTADGEDYVMEHHQDCCEQVHIDDIDGDLKDLEGSPILTAEESTDGNSSYGHTFYRLSTAKGHVCIRWLGESNGYYSIDVSFNKIKVKTA